MELGGKVVVVTGGARGIGAAMARRFAAEGAAGVVVADLDETTAAGVAADIVDNGGRAAATRTDVSDEDDVRALVALAESTYGPVDLFCSNAGIAAGAGLEADDATWQRVWAINVMSHVYAARAVLPSMVSRGSGYLLQTCSAAGLLTSPGDAPYTATKHAAVALAEWLALTYGDKGIRVSALCPQGVRTDLLMPGIEAGNFAALAVAAAGPILEPDDVAALVVEAIGDERFLILPHPEVARYEAGKVADRDHWLGALRGLLAGAQTPGA